MNLNFIELLTILRLITIRNSSDGKHIKLQATKRLVQFFKSFFYSRPTKLQLIILLSALECTEKSYTADQLCTRLISTGQVFILKSMECVHTVQSCMCLSVDEYS